MRRMNLDHPNPEPQNMLHIGQNIFGMPGMHRPASNQPPRIGLHIIGHPLIHRRSKPNHLGRNIINERRPLHPAPVQIFKKRRSRSRIGFNLLKISPLRLHQRQRRRREHLIRLDMNVAVSNQGEALSRQLSAVNFRTLYQDIWQRVADQKDAAESKIQPDG